MIITPRPLPLDLLGKSDSVRDPGVHMSEIYNDLYAELEPDRYDKSKPMNPLYLEVGLAFEEIIEEKLVERFGRALGGERPGEFFTDEEFDAVTGELLMPRVAYNPDLIIYDDEPGAILGEIKLTWMSAKGVPEAEGGLFPDKFNKYFTQMKAYAYHLGLDRGRLIVFFVNGTYKPPVPQLRCWDFRFTAQELRENWLMLKNHYRHMQRRKK